MKNLALVAVFFATAFAITAIYKRNKISDRVVAFWELYEDNDVELEWLLND